MLVHSKSYHCNSRSVLQIYSNLIIVRYLDRKKVLSGDTASYEYRWGLRAQHEISKRQVLEFVAQVRERLLLE